MVKKPIEERTIMNEAGFTITDDYGNEIYSVSDKGISIEEKPITEVKGQKEKEMKLYTYNNLEAKYMELDKRTLLNLLIAGERKNIYVNFSKDNTNDRYYFNRAKDKDIKEFLNPEVEDVKVAINSKDILDYLKNLRIAQPWVIPDSSLTINQGITLDHDIVIGINKDLELPTVFIDGEKAEDGLVNVVLDWETGKEYIASGFSRVIVRTLNKKGLEETMSIHKGPKHER